MIAGDITQVTYNHPTLGTGTFYPVANTDNTFNTGTFKKDDNKNGIDGGGRAIVQMSRQRWQFKCTISWDMNNTEEMETISAMMNNPEPATWTVSHINGSIYNGVGHAVGDNDANGNTAQIDLMVQGSGSLTKL